MANETSTGEHNSTMAWARYPYEGFVVLVTGAGSGIGRAIAQAFLEQGATVAVSGRREEPLAETAAWLGRAADELAASKPELAAEALRIAQEHLGEITGRTLPDDLLGAIFSTFCIGK